MNSAGINRFSISSDSHGRGFRAFTLLELCALVGMLGLLCVMCVPALCRQASPSRVAACAAHFRQWSVSANLYAADNQEWLPNTSMALSAGGMYLWDVGPGFYNMLGKYGMAVPDWFCPMRPNELAAANTLVGHPIQTVDELGNSGAPYNEENLHVNYWVPRTQGGVEFPKDLSKASPALVPVYLRGADPVAYGWPRKLHDIAAARIPFVSDLAVSGGSPFFNSPNPPSTDVNNLARNTAHFVNGNLLGVNVAFADGRVEAHAPAQMRPYYFDQLNYWFY